MELELVENEPVARPFQCDWQNCHKSFDHKFELQRHYRFHANERPFACYVPGCGKAFIQRSALIVHMRTHTGEKPHQCQHIGCGKRFSDSSSLARHRRIHSQRRPYKCPRDGCSKSFCSKSSMVKHQREVHQQGMNPNDIVDDCSSDPDDEEPSSTSQHSGMTPHGSFPRILQQGHFNPHAVFDATNPSVHIPEQGYYVTDQNRPGTATMASTPAPTQYQLAQQQAERPPIEPPYSTTVATNKEEATDSLLNERTSDSGARIGNSAATTVMPNPAGESTSDVYENIHARGEPPASRPETPFSPSFLVPATPPDLYFVTENSQNLSQSIWENFQPDQLFPDTAAMPAIPHLAPYTDSGYGSAPTTRSEINNLRKHGYQTASAARSEQNPVEQDVEDTATEYSNTSSRAISRQGHYIREFAEDLFSKIGALTVDEKTRSRASAILPDLLKAFALKVGHNGKTQMHRDVMVFVHRHRREIEAAFADICCKQDEEDLGGSRSNSDDMSLQERMSLWERNRDLEEFPVEEELEMNPLSGDEDEEMLENWLFAYREFVLGIDAYDWLLTRLQREFRLVPTEPNTIGVIRGQILSWLPSSQRISRQVSSQSCSSRFELDWDILGFFETQGYLDRPDQIFEGVITLTGSCRDAQAASCAQYIHQTWPLTGDAMVQLIKEVLRNEEGYRQLWELSDETTLFAWISRPKFTVEAYGVAVSIAETGEQLAWLGAALRNSPRQRGPIHCTPVITNIFQNSAPLYSWGPRPSSTDITCEIGFTMEEVPEPLSAANGQCWHDIFKNPVVVKGYPIRRRLERNTGLEIPLNIMAGLARTRRVDRFDGKVYIKGFSTMLVPTKRNKDILCWHLIYNKDGGRISYLDDYMDQEQNVGRLDLESLRHVLGWCSEARFYAGSAQAHYTVAHSGLPKPHAGCALAKAQVSSGRMIMGGPAFHIGAKDTPAQISRNGYIPRLKWISTKFVLLWDEQDKRGWLINGTSALLHVVRASLAHDSKDRFRSAFLFKSEDLQESPRPFTADSAIDVLINSENLGLKLYPEKDGYLLLESRIDHFYNVLEKLIDHQTNIFGDRGAESGRQPRRYLEGWDFEDLATNRDPLYPRVATLGAAGKGWVDFTRAIHAVTLVGRGFGDIIRPAGVNLCEYWAKLPKQRYYIASCLSDLGDITRGHGSCDDHHVRLSDNLIWHTPTTVFGTCHCKGTLGQDHCEPVQTIFPSTLSRILLPRRHSIQLEGYGAVVFGHSSNFSWVWGDTGNPQEGELREATSSHSAAEVDSHLFKDSGIGPSLTCSGSEGRVSSLSRSNTRRSITSPGEFRADDGMPASWASVDSETYGRSQYTIGILCALPKELKAVRALFDSEHGNIKSIQGDDNQYALGKMANHMVVTACLPAGEYGTNSAASVASNMVRSFPALQFCLLVGIAGGAPSEQNDIRLGDVVVGIPTGSSSGVVQYDLGKDKESNVFEPTGRLRGPPRFLSSAISALRSVPNPPSDPLKPHLDKITNIVSEYRRPAQEDVLYETCTACRSSEKACPGYHVRQRDPRPTAIHYGPIGSGNSVIKNAMRRDELAREHRVLCFEMEAAGVVNAVPCLVIRGICDYCDIHKNDDWQNYAAATAAAYSKLLLSVVASKEARVNDNYPENFHSTIPKTSTGSKRRWSEFVEE